ncbi:endopeptidase [Clostridium tyrobutyricum]|uniref:endopeptidase n=1 Tax=Clostridium tyrobutyricum TaxID=1519 RepID=UPI001C38D605|nr:endopeptidase [Clostridium tyrobutyricum]MBV4419940.1 endopeptidase [Clostridium tyrobutyricum]
MGYYNSQYEDYYNQLKGKAKYIPHYNKTNNSNNKFNIGKFITKRIIRDLTGVLILSVIVVGCRFISTPGTKAVYSYSKKVINETYDYNSIKNRIKNISFKDIQDETKNVINRVQINLPN